MKPVKVAPNQFVNLDHVVEFTYSPASTRTEKIRDEHDHDISKNTHIELGSSLTITLSLLNNLPDHFHFFGLAGKRSFQSRKKPIHRNVDLDNFEFLSLRRSVTDFIGRL